MMSSAEIQYFNLIYKIEKEGIVKKPTKGACRSVFGHIITLIPTEVPLLKSRKIYWKGLVGELKAFLADESTVEGFEKYGCNFWGAWANEDGTLSVDYARLLHNFNKVNQLKSLVEGIKDKPDSRKHIISLWDPSSDSKQVPCVLSYQWYVVEGVLEMIWTQRSADVLIGLASDMFSAWLFNQVIALETGLKPGKVVMNLGDAHIYEIHKEKLRDLKRNYLHFNNYKKKDVDYSLTGSLHNFEFSLSNYVSEDSIAFELLT